MKFVKGEIDDTYTLLYYYDVKWLFFEDSIDPVYYNGTYYYVKNGMIGWNYKGTYFYIEYDQEGNYLDEKIIVFINGVDDLNFTGIMDNIYFDSGKIADEFNGVVEYEENLYYIEYGYLNKGYHCGEYKGIIYTFKDGGLNFEYTGVASTTYGEYINMFI